MTGRNEKAYCNPIWYEIALVNYKYNLLVCLFLLYIFQNALAECAKRISCIQYMQQDVRRINDFVQLAIYASRRALRVYRLDVVGMCPLHRRRRRGLCKFCRGLCLCSFFSSGRA